MQFDPFSLSLALLQLDHVGAWKWESEALHKNIMRLSAQRMRVWVESLRMRSQQIFISFPTARKIMQKYCRENKRGSKEERTRAGFIKIISQNADFILRD